MNKDKNTTGNKGEKKASKYLKNKGYKILDTNYFSKFGEIDIIAKIQNIVVFVEVKTRKSNDYTNAFESVTYRKKEKIIKTAGMYIMENNLRNQFRFDIIEVYTFGSENIKDFKVNHIENCFC